MDPPVEKDNSISMQPIESSPRISHAPDVLPLSTSNHAYEDIEVPQGGPTATSQLRLKRLKVKGMFIVEGAFS